ncbi:MAG TPA: transposase [Spirochaetia bacterium]|nr:transposase [Spirochaetia bacterium]
MGRSAPYYQDGGATKKSPYMNAQINYALQRAETGTLVAEVRRRVGLSENAFYRWKRKYLRMLRCDAWKLRQFEGENR